MLKCMHAFRPWCMHPTMNYGSHASRDGRDEAISRDQSVGRYRKGLYLHTCARLHEPFSVLLFFSLSASQMIYFFFSSAQQRYAEF
ncbi:hypothetical protein ZEAMMB73_Zm00001d032292 [Zea mays]|uniref:Uncharacterized protein n=1 Tax=Zea mays TaxID=4577 RepID=A0A1D6KPQ5_MAIZE|nr:hypothetical protein ZEAMMB73_Zm00001d032292 [Zea mays]